VIFPLRRYASITLLLVLASIPSSRHAYASDTTQFRGPSGDRAPQAFPDGDFGLEVAWTRALGSGYSNVWIEGQRAVTMYTAGEIDVVAAFSLEDGEELWRYELGPKYSGHDGSDDGPIGTPTVSEGMVYALGPAGQLVALDLETGSETWRRDLDEESSTLPLYGYTTSPLVIGEQIIIATGGEGHAVTAFDRSTGEPKWTEGDDAVSYQTPMVVELGGREQLLVVTNQFLQGLDPERGETLWQLRHTEGEEADESAHPTSIDSERFLVKYARSSRLYRWNGKGVEELWQSRAFANTYALPVLVGDHLYGFTGSVLTCASVETGEIAWRSRQPGGLGLSEVDGKLAIAAPSGELVLVDATPEGYREFTRMAVLDAGDYAIPSFSDGLFLVRNLTDLAAVRVDSSVAPQVAKTDDADRLQGEFGEWVASIEALSEAERQQRVTTYFENIEKTPISGEKGLTHLIWRGEAEDVGARGDFVTGGQEIGLFPVAGTDLFFRSLELDAKAQYTYNLIVDFGDPVLDPKNPYSVDNGFAVSSELRMPEWPLSPHLEEPGTDAPRGNLDGFPFHSEILGNSREIQVWRPAGYGDDSEIRYPLLVVNHGDNLLRGGLMRNTLDNLVGKTVAPLVAVFVPRAAPPEYGGPAADDYNRFLVEELLPHMDRHYLTDGETRAIMGPGSAGVAAVYAALSHPDVFQKAATQSFYPIPPAQDRIPELIASDGPEPELIYLVWSHNDYDLGDDRRADEASRALRDQLKAAGIEFKEQISNYSPGWGGWRGQDDEILETFYPLKSSD
jgi:outer membrane protein assembly factor BamB